MLKLRKEYVTVNGDKETFCYIVKFNFSEDLRDLADVEEISLTRYVKEELSHMNIDISIIGEDDGLESVWINVQKDKGNVSSQRKEVEKVINWFVKHTNKIYK